MTLSSDLRRIADELENGGEWQTTIRRAADALPEWRRVEDGLPEPGVEVICYRAGDWDLGHIADEPGQPRWVRDSWVLDPTHWMPLPPSPERTRE